MPPARTGYSVAQIALHWIIAVLISAQVVLHEGMHAAYREDQGGAAATDAERLMADLHVAGALYHHFVLKTDVMRRILRPERTAL